MCLCVYIWVYFEFIDRGSSNLSLYSARKSDKLFNQTFSHRFHCQWDILYSNSLLCQGLTDHFVWDGLRIMLYLSSRLKAKNNITCSLKVLVRKRCSKVWSWKVRNEVGKFSFAQLRSPLSHSKFERQISNFRDSSSDIPIWKFPTSRVLINYTNAHVQMILLFSNLVQSWGHFDLVRESLHTARNIFSSDIL